MLRTGRLCNLSLERGYCVDMQQKQGQPNTRAASSQTLEPLRQDLHFALRWLRKNALFSMLAVLILGLGVGATTAIFTVVNAVLLKPLPYRDADRIVVLSTLWKKNGPGGAHG